MALALRSRQLYYTSCQFVSSSGSLGDDLTKLDFVGLRGPFLRLIIACNENRCRISSLCCRVSEAHGDPEDKQALESVARAWEHLADEREDRLLKQIDGDTLID